MLEHRTSNFLTSILLLSYVTGDVFETRNNFLHDLRDILTNSSLYQNSNLPPQIDGGAVDINVSMQIICLQDVSEETMTFRADVYLFQHWNDQRLNMTSDNYDNLTKIALHPNFLDLFWLPDTFFSNVMESINPTNDNDKSFSHRSQLLINGVGDLSYSQRLSLTGRCPMDLKMYPFDFQICRLVLESYNYDDSQLDYDWLTAPVKLNLSEDESLPDFYFLDIFSTKTVTNEGGKNYSRLYVCFLFERKSGFYFMELYIPAGLIVIVAWLTSINADSTFGDLLAVLLAMLFLYFSYVTVMPKVSDFKAIDVYLIVCFIFVFLALIHKFLFHEMFHMDEEKSKEGVKVNPLGIDSSAEKADFPEGQTISVKRRRCSRFSCCSKKCFLYYGLYPTLFIAFCIIYFAEYSRLDSVPPFSDCH